MSVILFVLSIVGLVVGTALATLAVLALLFGAYVLVVNIFDAVSMLRR